MGLWSKTRDKVTGGAKDLIGGAKGLTGAALMGPMGWSAGAIGNYLDGQNRTPGRGPGDYNTPGEQAFAQGMAPTPGNPQLPGWQQAAQRAALGAGANPAAAAAAGMRARTQGLAGLGQQALPYWDRLMALRQQVEQQRSGINTTTPQNAFLQGFFGGGGAQGAGAMLSGSGGGASGAADWRKVQYTPGSGYASGVNQGGQSWSDW